MASKVEIINVALVSLGSATIALPIEETVNGRKTAAVYEPILKSMLRAHPWSFAKKEADLSIESGTPVLDDDYTYKYTLPPDFIRLLKTDMQPDYSHKIKAGRIYSNSATLAIEYIYYNEDPASYDDSFADAFSARIAAELCYSITGNKKLIEVRWAEHRTKLAIAKSVNGQEVTPDEPQKDEWTNART